MSVFESLNKVFKRAWVQGQIETLAEGLQGCAECRAVTPLFATCLWECAHHRNKRRSREWNERAQR